MHINNIQIKEQNRISKQCSKGEPTMENAIPNLGVCDTAVYQKQQTGENYLHQAKDTVRDMTCTAEST